MAVRGLGRVRTLRGRMLVRTLVLLALGLLVADVAAYIGLARHLEARSEAALDRVVIHLDELEDRGSIDVVTPSLEAAAFPGLAIVVRSPDGAIQASTAPARAVSEDGQLDGYRTRLWQPASEFALLGPKGRKVDVGSIVIGVSQAGDQETLRTLLLVELLIGGLVMAGGALVGRSLLRRELQPLREMAAAAERIVRGSPESLPSGLPGSEVHELAVALEGSFGAQARSEAIARAFLADSSHELRTPLAAISGWADLYAAGALPSPDDIRAAMTSVAAESSRMSSLVEQMLALARLDAGVVGLSADFNVGEMVADSCASVRPLLGATPGRLELNLESDPSAPPSSSGDVAALRRAVDNLIVNAVRHSGPLAQVRVVCRIGADQWEVSVEDDGPGLRDDDLERAFDRFWRGDPSRGRDVGGSGLGLAIARETARSHGGDVVLAHREHGGLVARLAIPHGGEPSESPQENDRKSASRSDGSLSELSIMSNSAAAPTGFTSIPVRRPWLIVGSWIAAVVVAGALAAGVGSSFSNDISLEGTPSSRGADILDDGQEISDSAGGTAVLQSADGIRTERESVDRLVAQWRAVPGVVEVADPFAPGTVSRDGTTATIWIRLSEQPMKADADVIDAIESAAAQIPAVVTVDFAGALGQAIEKEGRSHLPELAGLAAAFLVLVLIFGSLAAALTPIISAVVAVVLGLALLMLLAGSVSLGTATPSLASMIGLGCGIDYALFMVTRARQHMHDGVPPPQAIRGAVTSSGHAVLVAAGTVACALLGLYFSGVTFVGRLGLGATVAVLTSAIAAVTLVPAILSILGRNIDAVAMRAPVAESAGKSDRWSKYALWVSARPLRVMAAGLGVLAVLAVPALDLRLGHVSEGAGPEGSTTRVAFDALERSFGAGANGRFTAVLALRVKASFDDPRALEVAHEEISNASGVESVSEFKLSDDGTFASAIVTPAFGPEDSRAASLHRQLSTTTAQEIESETGAELMLTGPTAAEFDFIDRISSRLPVIIVLVLLASFLLLGAAFRSPVVAFKAAMMSLVSIAASYGVLVAVFQWQWGSALLGIQESVPIESFVPMMMFAIVFGLSMDYEVFLLSRVRDAWHRGADTTAAVADGLASTARVISAAAMIMVFVFGAFALSDDVAVKMTAIGLAASVVIDVTVVRLLLVPATMVVLGDANWWSPAWLRRRTPARQEERITPQAPRGRDSSSAEPAVR